MCIFQKISIPPHPTEGNGNSEGGGGGVQRESISEAVGVTSQVFFPEAPSKIDEQA